MGKKKGHAAEQTESVAPENEAMQPFPVVAIGCSAGGLDALKKLLGVMPSDIGMAFVLLQHLDPTHDSLLVELLTRYTTMQVVQIESNMPVEPNTIHIIPPNTSLTIKNGVLLLGKAVEHRGIRMPVDHFFMSLAEDQQENAVCIILSGTGSDGTLGLKEIKARGGLAIVQDPGTAQYDGMPRSAVATGLADYILPVEQIPSTLTSYVSHSSRLDQLGEPPLLEAEDKIHRILTLLHARTGHDFRCYKKNTLLRRLGRRMTVHQINELNEYIEYIEKHPEEIESLDKDLLISVTSFFREPAMWEAIKDKVIGKLIAPCNEKHKIRVWVPGCASGEEAYSIAMLLVEELEKRKMECQVQIYATDIDNAALETGRRGVYHENIIAQLSPERLSRFFVRDANGTYRVNKSLREMVVFAQQNIISDPPFSKLDLISCRNVLIYMQLELQKKVLTLFHFALHDGGFLVLGSSESAGQRTDLFEPLSRRWRIYRQLSTVHRIPLDLPLSQDRRLGEMFLKPEAPPALRFADIAKARLLQRFAPPSVLVDKKYEALFFSGVTRDFLFLPEGVRTNNVLEMADPGLKPKLRTALHKAGSEKKEIVMGGIRLSYGNGEHTVRLTVVPIPEGKDAAGLFLISFETEPAVLPLTSVSSEDISGESVIRTLEEELKRSKDELQATIEQMDASNEELKVSNEEIMSMNEELQSTNEELETSREELQSMNEELSTMNTQLQDKVSALEITTDDMNNLLTSTNISTIFISRDFRIKRYTPVATELLNLIPSDIGRPLGDITRKFSDDALFDDAGSVLRNLIPLSKEIMSDDGKWFIRRIQPYRTSENKIEGVVITFNDVTELKNAQQSIEQYASIVEGSQDAIIGMNANGIIRNWNKGAEHIYGYTADDIIGKPLAFIIPDAGNAMSKISQGESGIIESYGVRKDGERVELSLLVSPMLDLHGAIAGASVIARDITMNKLINDKLKEAYKELEAFSYSVSHDLRAPLRQMSSFAELLKKRLGDSPDEKVKYYFSAIAKSYDNMNSLIDNLLNFSRLGRTELQKVRINMNILTKEIVAQVHQEAKERDIKWKLDKLPEVNGDPSMLKLALENLISNAVKFTRMCPEAKIEIGCREEKDEFIFSVKDNGAGFDMKNADRLFNVFQRLHSQNEFEGTGIGLANVQRIISRHGGRTWAEGAVGQGATFYFTLPVAKELIK